MSITHAHVLARRIIPAAAVGALSAIALIVVSVAAEHLQNVLWGYPPDGVGRGSAPWIMFMLTATGVVVGLLVWLAAHRDRPEMVIKPKSQAEGAQHVR
jgi:H+/Cl- antiporter ClcA